MGSSDDYLSLADNIGENLGKAIEFATRDLMVSLDRQTEEMQVIARNLDEHLTSMVDYLATIAEAVGARK